MPLLLWVFLFYLVKFKMGEEIYKNILKSNTSLVGMTCKDGIVLGADRRSTAGTLIYHKNERKIHKINFEFIV